MLPWEYIKRCQDQAQFLSKRTYVGAKILENCLATNCNCIFYIYHDSLRTIPKILDSARYNFLLGVIANTHCQKSSTCI